MANRGGFSDLLAPGFREIFFQRWGRYPEQFSKVLNVLTSKRQYEEESAVTGLGLMPQKTEQGAITYDDPLQGYDKRYTHLTYGMGFRVSEELWEDDLYGIMKRMPDALGVSARQTVETVAWSLFNNGFTDSAAYLGPDGEPLFGDGSTKTHPLVGGGTWANQLNPAADLSVSSLQSLIELMENTVDDRGLKLSLKPKVLLVPLQLKWAARELLDSDNKPYTANNEVNALQDEDLRYFVSNWLTDTDAFYLLTEKMDHTLKLFWRRKLAFKNDDDFDTGDAKFKATMRLSVGYTDPRGIVASPGA